MADCVGNYCRQLPDAVYPTSVYEIMMAFTIGLILWALRKRLTPLAGMLFALYLAFNGAERFLIEKNRVNDRHEVLGGFTQAEFIAVILFCIGLLWAGWILAQKKRSVDPVT